MALADFWNKDNLARIMNSVPDPLENEAFNTELTSILRSDALVFEPEIDRELFVSPLEILKKHVNEFETKIPFLSHRMISADSELYKSVKNTRLDISSPSTMYPNNALIVHANSELDRKILDALLNLKNKKSDECFKFRSLTCQQVNQFCNDAEYVNPLIRAGQVITLPSFRQPDSFFWDIYKR